MRLDQLPGGGASSSSAGGVADASLAASGGSARSAASPGAGAAGRAGSSLGEPDAAELKLLLLRERQRVDKARADAKLAETQLRSEKREVGELAARAVAAEERVAELESALVEANGGTSSAGSAPQLHIEDPADPSDEERMRFVDSNAASCSIPDPMLCRIGPKQWSREQLVREARLFAPVYKRRPVATNVGGMRLNNMFALWFVLRNYNFSAVIESGVHKGQGTWLIRQALPKARIFSFDPSPDAGTYSKDSADLLFVGKRYRPWTSVDWAEVGIDRSRTLLVWDDHTDIFTRLTHMHALGFEHSFVEDNYGSCTGTPSPKQLCDRTGGVVYAPGPSDGLGGPVGGAAAGAAGRVEKDPNPFDIVHWDKKHYLEKQIPYMMFGAKRRWFLRNVDVYREVPPLFWKIEERAYTLDDGTKYAPGAHKRMHEAMLFPDRKSAARSVPELASFPEKTEYTQYGACAYLHVRPSAPGAAHCVSEIV